MSKPPTTPWWSARKRPRALVLVERELWPNWLGVCFERAVPVWVVNARLAERTAAAYAKRAAWCWPIGRAGTGRGQWAQTGLGLAGQRLWLVLRHYCPVA